MVELKQKHKVEEYNNRFKHLIEVTYPKENVKNMIEAWNDKTNKLQEWLDDFEKIKEETVADTIRRLDESIVKKDKELVEFESLSDEEKFKKLMEQFEIEKKEFKEFKEKLSEHKDEAVKNVEEELKKYKVKAEAELKQLLDAKTLWSNPTKKY